MATTVASWASIDDTEIDAESPITETLMKRNRDNSYWIDAGTRQTTQTSASKVLVPDGSGGVEWVEVATLSAINGTSLIDNTIGGAPVATVTIPSNVVLATGIFNGYGATPAPDEYLRGSFSYNISSKVLTYESLTSETGGAVIAGVSGIRTRQITLTSSYQALTTDFTAVVSAKIDGSDLYFKHAGANGNDEMNISATFH